MKNLFAFALVASMLSLAACSERKAETTAVDSSALTVDSTASAPADSVASDSTVATDSVATK